MSKKKCQKCLFDGLGTTARQGKQASRWEGINPSPTSYEYLKQRLLLKDQQVAVNEKKDALSS
jgi:hypothetical protein